MINDTLAIDQCHQSSFDVDGKAEYYIQSLSCENTYYNTYTENTQMK